MYDTYDKFRCKFRNERVPSRQKIHNLVKKLKPTGLLIDKKQKLKRQALTEEELYDIQARLEHTPRKSLKRLAQETGVSKFTARRETQLLKLRPFKTTVTNALQPRDPVSMVQFCSWFVQSVVEGEIDPQLTFFSDEALFHLQGYISTQSSHRTTSNPRSPPFSKRTVAKDIYA
jgi:hypothetical protein